MSATLLATRRRGLEPLVVARTCGQVILAIMVLAAVIRAGYFVGTSYGLIAWPHEAIGGESTMLYESQLIADHGLLEGLRLIYGPQGEDRFTAGNYPPVYVLLWALEPGASGFPTGRLLSLLAGVVTAGAGGLAVYTALARRGSRSVAIGSGVLGGALFLCNMPVFQQVFIAKPDMVALALAACGLAIFEWSKSRLGIILAGGFFALGLLTKQSIAFALLAALVAAYGRSPRDAIRLAVTVGAIGIVALGLLWLIAGPTLFERLIIYNTRPWREDRLISLDRKFLALHWLLVVPALGYTLWGLRHRVGSALTYYPFVALATLVTVGAEGGARNYYIELCLAASLGAALAIGTLLNGRAVRWLPAGAVTVGLVAIFVLRAYTVFVRDAYIPEPPVQDAAYRNWVLSVVDATPDPILSDDVSYLAMRDRPVIIDDNFLCTIVREKGLWEDDGIVADLKAQRYPLVLAVRTENEEQLRQLWGDDIVDALYENYVPLGDGRFIPERTLGGQNPGSTDQ